MSLKKNTDSHLEIDKEIIQQKNWRELLKANLYQITMLSFKEKSRIIHLIQKKELLREDKKELMTLLIRLKIEDLIKLFGKSFEEHAKNYVHWGMDWYEDNALKKRILNDYLHIKRINNLPKWNKYLAVDLFEDLRECIKKLVPYEDLNKLVKNNDGHLIDRTLSDRDLSFYLGRVKNHIKYIKAQIKENPNHVLLKEPIEYYKYYLWQEFGYISKAVSDFFDTYVKLNKFGIIYQNHPDFQKDFFRIINTLEKAYWLGFLFADGSIQIETYIDKNGVEIFFYRLKFSQSIRPKTDNRHVDKKITVRRFTELLGLNKNTAKILKKPYEFGIRILNNDFVKHLISLGLIPGKKKSKNIELPDFRKKGISFQVLRKLYLAFLLGYYDGDGTKDATRITSGSLKFLEQIKGLFGIKNIIGSKPGAFYLNLGPELFNEMMDIDFKQSMSYLRRKFKVNNEGDNLWNKRMFKLIECLDFFENCDFNTFIQSMEHPVRINFDRWIRNYFKKAVYLIRNYESKHKRYSVAQLIRDLGGFGYKNSTIVSHSTRIIKQKFGMTFEQLKKYALFGSLPSHLERRRAEFQDYLR